MDTILKFLPIYKSVIWGGEKIAKFKGLDIDEDHMGESWELSPVKGNESVVKGGRFAGRTLPSMIVEYGNDIMGERLMRKYGAFPLLIKFIDSRDDLSIQVHPNDDLAQKRHNSPGKTEMWYSVQPAADAYLYAGFSRKVTPEEFESMARDGTVTDCLARYNVTKGDVFFLPAGRVHSIGKGNFLLEVQQASDITYRLYDYMRKDKDGKMRDLHLEEAWGAIDFDDLASSKEHIILKADESATLAECGFFSVVLNNLKDRRDFDFSEKDSFVVLVSVGGDFILDKGGQNIPLRQGETALVPWSLPKLPVEGSGDLISIFIPA